VICLFSDAQVQDLALGPNGILQAMRPGSVLVIHTTSSPSLARALAAAGARNGVAVVDAPVSGTAEDIAAGQVTVMLGGGEADVDRVRRVVAAYGDPVLHLGPLGSAQAVKLINNALFAAHVQLAGEAARIAAGFGADMATVAAAIQQSSGASYAMDVVLAMGSIERTTALAGPFLRKDIDTVSAVASELDIDLGELGHVLAHGPLSFEGRSG
jgi:3-hydroxyisobutyrate dehydrogenase-like beta-hydroxyacid dehydrogenase